MSKATIDRKQPVVTHRDLALCFLKIALVSFGGGLSAWARQVIIEERQWLTDEEFLTGIQSVLTGVVAAGVGLTLSMGVKAGLDILRQPMAVALAAAAFVGMAILRWPLWIVIAGLAPIGMAWYWPRDRTNRKEDPAR